MLTVIAQYRTRPGAGDEVAAALEQHVAATRTEAGCVRFVVNRSVEDPDRFILYEQYTGESAFESHRQSPHFKRYIEGAVLPLLLERTWARYQLVEPPIA